MFPINLSFYWGRDHVILPPLQGQCLIHCVVHGWPLVIVDFEWMIQAVYRSGLWILACPVFFQQCTSVRSSKSRAGKQYGSRGKDRESFKLWPHHFSTSRDSWVRDREGSHLNCNTSTWFGGSFPFQAAFGIKCLPCVSGLLGWWNPKSVWPKRERAWKVELGTLASCTNHAAYKSLPWASNCSSMRLSIYAKWG